MKITRTGDIFKTHQWNRQARVQMDELLNDMAYNDLANNKLEKRPERGVVISCHSSQGQNVVNIHVDPVYMQPGGGVEHKRKFIIKDKFYWYAFSASAFIPEIGEPTLYTGGNVPLGLSIDTAGNSYVGGGTNITHDGWYSREPFLLKYDKDGLLQWRRVINGSSAMDQIQASDFDEYGNLYAGYVQNNSTRGVPDAYVAKYLVDGSLQWQQRLTLADDTVSIFVNGSCISIDDTDPTLNEFSVCGMLYHAEACGYRTYLAKFSSTGALVWQKNLGLFVDGDPRDCNAGGSWSEGDSTSDGQQRLEQLLQLRSLTSGAGGSIYGVGHIWGVGSVLPSGLVVKFDSSGTLVWKVAINGFRHQFNDLIGLYNKGLYLMDCCLDADDNLYIAGYNQINYVNRIHCHVFKFSSDGTLLWTKSSESYADGTYDIPPVGHIAHDGGRVYTLFPKDNISGHEYGMTLSCLGATDGDPAWSKHLTFPSFDLYGKTFQGISPEGIEVRNQCIWLIGSLTWSEMTVTMKLPQSGPPAGQFTLLEIWDPTDSWVDTVDLPYLEETGEGVGYYYFDTQTVFDLDISSGNFIKGTFANGDTFVDLYEQTDIILESSEKIEITGV